MTRYAVKFPAWIEVEVEVDVAAPEVAAQAAQDKLDRFREATLPAQEWGVTIWRNADACPAHRITRLAERTAP